MKIFVLTSTLVLLLVMGDRNMVQAQELKKSYRILIDSAFVLRKNKKYLEGITLIKQALQIDTGAQYWAYLHIANFAALDRRNDSAFLYLNKVLFSPIAGNVSWKYYAERGLKPLRNDARWSIFQHAVDSIHSRKDSITLAKQHIAIKIQQKIENDAEHLLTAKNWKLLDAEAVYDSIRSYTNNYLHRLSSRYLCFYISLNDTFRTCYLIQLPQSFNYKKKYPLLVVLHGAVRYNHPPKFADSTALGFFFTPYAHYADSLGFISVYPFASPQYNWMTADQGFALVPDIIKNMKRCFNINDAEVYISGHSNGATGAFNYLVKGPTPFAAFSGFNNKPVVLTGGTFIKNAADRNFYSISTDKDYYFPLEGHLKLAEIADSLGIKWHNDTYYGFPHWFPSFSQSDTAFQHIFAFMTTQRRNPFQHHLYWQCDDVKHGRCDWLQINQLDTTQAPADWAKPVNFTVSRWIDARDTSNVRDSTASAFAFPRKSGAVNANYDNNIFSLKTSCVKSITVYLSPEMIDFNKPVIVKVNGRKVFDQKMDFDKGFMFNNFKKTFDRQAVWVNKITLSH